MPWTDPGRLALAAGWVGLLGAATVVAPQETTAFDLELVTSLTTRAFSGDNNPLFESLFNMLGVIPAVNAALLLPGAKVGRCRLTPGSPRLTALGFRA